MINRNKITGGIIICTLILLLVACGSNKSLTQRHYNNRYYIGMSKGDPVSQKTSETDSLPVFVASAGTDFTADVKNERLLTTDDEQNDTADKNSAGFFPDRNSSDNEKIQPQNLREISHPKLDEYPFAILEKTNDLKEKLSPPTTEGDALSLLWIVIVILLIIWLIGFVFGGFGLGGAIHILALIALILLILWLLRVI